MLKPVPPTLPEKHMATIDVLFAVLLLIATLSTAVCVYQATRWNGVQAIDFGESAQYRTESIRATTIANSQTIIDAELFLDWVNAASTGDLRQKEFIEGRFRSEFRPAFEAWKAEANATNPIPPGTPFDRPEYNIAKNQESALLEEQAAAAFDRGKDANLNGDLYISNTVLFAIVLFFCGVYTRWEELRIRQAILVVTLIVFTFALYLMGSLLFRVGYI